MSTVKVTHSNCRGQGQGHFSEGSRQEVYDFLLGVAGSEIPSPMASFSS